MVYGQKTTRTAKCQVNLRGRNKMEPVKSKKQKYRWRRGTVSASSEHIELTCGDKNIPVARVAPPVDNTFTVEILINEERAINLPTLKAARASLNLYLAEREEPDQWEFVKRHCSSSSNRFSLVLWSYYPEGK